MSENQLLDLYKNGAKILLKAVKAGDEKAIERVRPYFKELTAPKLTEMQLVVAREAGLDSWAALREYAKIQDQIAVSFKTAEQLKDKAQQMVKKNLATLHDGLNCSFCGKHQAEVKKLISGPANTYICNECVRLCDEILDEENIA